MLFDGAASRLVPSLFLGTALSISSIKIVAMVVREMNFMRRNLGQVIVATAIMEDTVGWVIIAITFGIAGAGSGGGAHGVDWLSLAKTVGGVALFLVFCFTAGRWLVFAAIRWVNDNFRSDFPVITAILVIMGVLCADHPASGRAHRAGRLHGGGADRGIAHPHRPYPGPVARHDHRFLHADLLRHVGPGRRSHHPQGPAIWRLLTGRAGRDRLCRKILRRLCRRHAGRPDWREGIALGCAMNARGSTEVIVASIGLSMGALTPNLYTMIVTMAVITTMAMPPMLRAALSRLPMSKEEETRIAREAMDQKGFLPRLERLLLAVDDSAVGRMAARLAGPAGGRPGHAGDHPEAGSDLRDRRKPARTRRRRQEEGSTSGQQEEEPGKPEHAEQDRGQGHRRRRI